MLTAKNKPLSVDLTPLYLEGLDLLINDGLYENQDEVIKDALRRLFNHYNIGPIGDACTNNCDPQTIANETDQHP